MTAILRRAGPALLLAVAVLGTVLALGTPRFTWLSSGLRIDHPWPRGVAALAGSLGLVVLAWATPRTAARLVLAFLASGLLVLGLDRLAWRVDASDASLARRSLLGSQNVRWNDVAHVQLTDSAIVVTARDATRLGIGTARFHPDDRARLERTIARRVREASAAAPPARPAASDP